MILLTKILVLAFFAAPIILGLLRWRKVVSDRLIGIVLATLMGAMSGSYYLTLPHNPDLWDWIVAGVLSLLAGGIMLVVWRVMSADGPGA
jgi:peptidoglycan/LPS O-acetylase OafA/YrhL